MILVRSYIKKYYQLDSETKIDIDSALTYLLDNNLIDSIDGNILLYVAERYKPSEIAKLLSIDRRRVHERLNKVSRLIAERLGVPYLDEKKGSFNR